MFLDDLAVWVLIAVALVLSLETIAIRGAPSEVAVRRHLDLVATAECLPGFPLDTLLVFTECRVS
jgi:hypothetical protein